MKTGYITFGAIFKGSNEIIEELSGQGLNECGRILTFKREVFQYSVSRLRHSLPDVNHAISKLIYVTYN